jgi:hypothetical protein
MVAMLELDKVVILTVDCRSAFGNRRTNYPLQYRRFSNLTGKFFRRAEKAGCQKENAWSLMSLLLALGLQACHQQYV